MPLYLTKSEDGSDVFIKANSYQDLSNKFEKLDMNKIAYTKYAIIDSNHWFICECIKSINDFVEGSKYIYSYSDGWITVFYNTKSMVFQDPNKFLQYFKHISQTFIR